MAETVIFEVNIQDSLTKLVGLRKQLDDIKLSQENLANAVKAGTISNDEYITTNEALKVVTKNVSAEYRSAQRLLEGYSATVKESTDTTNFQNNSVRQNRLLLKQLTEQYNDTKNPTQQFANNIKQLSTTLKAQESAIGDNRRSVGGYAEGIKQAFGELRIGNVNLGQVTGGLKDATNGFKAAGGGVKGFSAALATTGLPLIVAGINLLINAFQSFKPVADAVENSVTALSSAFRALVTGGNITEAVTQSLELLETLRDLEDTQAAFNLQTEKQRNELGKLIIQSKDRTKTEAERTALLEKAEQIERTIFDNSVKRTDDLLSKQRAALKSKLQISDAELKILSEQDTKQALALRARLEREKGLTDEELAAFQKTLQERASLEGESAKFLEKIVNSRNKLVEKEDAEREKFAAKEAARKEALRAAEEKYRNDLAKLLDDFTLTERDKLEKGFNDKLALIKGQSVQELALIELITQQRVDALGKFDEAQAKRIEAEKIAIEKQQNEIFLRDAELNNQRLLQVQTQNELLLELQTDYQLTSDELYKEYLNSDVESYSEFLKKKSQLYKQDAANKVQADNIKIQSEKAALQASESISKDVIGLVGQVADAQGAGAEFAKALAFVQILTSQAIAIAGAVSGGVASGAATGPGAIGTIPAFIATLVGAVTAVIGGAIGLLAKPVPKPAFAKGVIGLNGAGTSTSDSIDARLSRGESVMTARATERFAPVLAQMEMAVGNKPNYQLGNRRFANGFIPVNDGGFTARSMTRTSEDRAFMQSAIRNGFANAPQPIVTVEEINRVNTSSENSVAVSEL